MTCIKNHASCFDSCFVIRNWRIYITMNSNIIVDPDALNMKFFDREMNYCLLVIIENYSNIYYIYDYDIALCMCWLCIVCNHSLTKKNMKGYVRCHMLSNIKFIFIMSSSYSYRFGRHFVLNCW